MKYKKSVIPSLSVRPVTGAQIGSIPAPSALVPWQPSTWPSAPSALDARFVRDLDQIFRESVLEEIENVIKDAEARNGDSGGTSVQFVPAQVAV
jgi:hypothetical protein